MTDDVILAGQDDVTDGAMDEAAVTFSMEEAITAGANAIFNSGILQAAGVTAYVSALLSKTLADAALRAGALTYVNAVLAQFTSRHRPVAGEDLINDVKLEICNHCWEPYPCPDLRVLLALVPPAPGGTT